MKKIILSLFAIASLCVNTLAYSWLYVSDPQDWSKSGQGSIDEFTLTIQPKGIYMECELYMTFSGKGYDFTADDTLEVSFYFSLPEGAIVHDSWLWVEDSIVHAKIMDRWSAYQIYESIVKRRRDPSVLYKDWENNYQLRIFPMAGNSSRKVKITYLVPANWSGMNVSAPLPLDILQSSYIPLNKIKIVSMVDNEWKNPHIPGYPEFSFEVPEWLSTQRISDIDIENSYFNKNLQIAYSSPIENGVYLSQYGNGEEGIYQMALLPSEVFKMPDDRKVLVLLDFEKENSYNANGNDVFNNLKSTLLNYLHEGDFFNIILSGPAMTLAGQTWIPADSASINMVFAKLGVNPVKDYTDLPTLLETGINFINAFGVKAEMLLLSNSDNFGDQEKANELMDKLKKMGKLPVTHVINFYDRYETWYYIGNQYFNGNEYLYTMLTRQSGGNFYTFDYWSNTIPGVLSQAFTDLGGILTSFDLHTTLEDGFCYGRYNINSNELATYLRRPILQVGKYHGKMPFVIEASGIYNGQVKSTELKFDAAHMHISDTLNEEMWTGNFIQSLEDNWTYDNKIIQSVIDASLSERVLSRYTAFLALEPGMEVVVDPQDPVTPGGDVLMTEDVAFSNFGESVRVDVTGEKEVYSEEQIQMRTYPNPFSDHVFIRIDVPDQIEWQRVRVEIFDMTGRKIKEFTPGDYNYNGFINIEWNVTGSQHAPVVRGIYMVVVTGETFKKQMKILKID